MKTILLLFLLLAPRLLAQYVFTDVDKLNCKYILYAGKGEVTAPLIYGGDGSQPKPEWAGKIVLVDRSAGMSLLTKLNNVKNAGGVAVIIANNDAGDWTPSIGASNTSTFTGVGILKSDGDLLKQKAGQTITVGYNKPGPAAPSGVKVGRRVTFIAEMQGYIWPDPTFQWFKDGVPIPGATSVALFINYVRRTDAGTYTVEVRNSAGFAVSPPEVFTVDP